MDPRGLRARLTGAGCTSCGAAIPVDRIAVLADRGDLAFVELRCPVCGSRTLGVVVAGDGTAPSLDTARHPELDPATEARLAGAPALGQEDVAAMGRFLSGWQGDLRTLLDGGPTGRPDGEGRP
jgi:DNA-directed RNA polymerase subunit RPC12/RpoP